MLELPPINHCARSGSSCNGFDSPPIIVINMKRKHSTTNDNVHKQKLQKQAIVFHEAGHAAAIYLNNKAHNLPPIYFQIILNDSRFFIDENGTCFQATHDQCTSRVEGGRLIEEFVLNIADLSLDLMIKEGTVSTSTAAYLSAFDADIINLLVGPLAEAKFSYSRDDELFTHKMVNLAALKNYGGEADLDLVHEYIESFSSSHSLQEAKMAELFKQACEFVTNASHWQAITKLANYILLGNKNVISCEEIEAVLV